MLKSSLYTYIVLVVKVMDLMTGKNLKNNVVRRKKPPVGNILHRFLLFDAIKSLV